MRRPKERNQAGHGVQGLIEAIKGQKLQRRQNRRCLRGRKDPVKKNTECPKRGWSSQFP
jgi:hypothetical protein